MKRSIFVSIKDAKVFKSRNDFVQDFINGKKIKLLDVGNLGEGEEYVKIKSFVEKEGGEYYGLDVNKNLASKLGNKNQLIGDLHNVGAVVDDESFDCVYGGQIIEHSWMPNLMVKECRRILRSGGYLVLDTPNAFDIENIARLFVLKKDTLGFDVAHLTYNEAKDNFTTYRENELNISSQPQHKIFYGPAMLRQLLNMHGFEVEYFAYILKPKNLLHKIFLKAFPQGSQKIGVVARKESIDKIFEVSETSK